GTSGPWLSPPLAGEVTGGRHTQPPEPCQPQKTNGPAPSGSPLAQDQIDCPTPTDMRAGTAQVPEDVGVGPAGFFEAVGQNGEAGRVQVAAGEVAVVVGGLWEGDDGWCLPGGGDGDGPEGVAEDFADQPTLPAALLRPVRTGAVEAV